MIPQVSVILPIYNAELFLKDCLRSILNQEGVIFEVLAINDGSTDSSLSILKSCKDNRLKIIENFQNKGLIYSLNKAIELAQAPYIARIDADDVCLPGRFLKQYMYLENNPSIDVVGSHSEYIDSEDRLLKNHKGLSVADDQIKQHLLFGNIISHPSVMIRSDIFLNYKFEMKYYVAEDYGLWVNLVTDGKLIHIIKEPLIRYRRHKGNISRLKTKEKFASIRKIIQFQFDKYGLEYTPYELDIQTFVVVRGNISTFDMKEIELWFEKLYFQLVGISWNKQNTRHLLFYYYLQVYLTRYKKQPWKWYRSLLFHHPYMPDKFMERLRVISSVIYEKMNL